MWCASQQSRSSRPWQSPSIPTTRVKMTSWIIPKIFKLKASTDSSSCSCSLLTAPTNPVHIAIKCCSPRKGAPWRGNPIANKHFNATEFCEIEHATPTTPHSHTNITHHHNETQFPQDHDMYCWLQFHPFCRLLRGWRQTRIVQFFGTKIAGGIAEILKSPRVPDGSTRVQSKET